VEGSRIPPVPSSLCHPAELAISRILKINAQVLERALKSAEEQLEVLGTFDFSGLLHQLYRLVHVLLCFAVVAFDVIKMSYAAPSVYRENRFSVDFEENPMFAGVKQGSLFCDQDEFGEELDLRTAVDLAVVDPAVDHGVPFGLADA
jgi:hypothetical protein